MRGFADPEMDFQLIRQMGASSYGGASVGECLALVQKFIPEHERVATLAVDYALSRPEVNPDYVALLGPSFGGYFSTRAAAYEPRIRAVIPNSPIVDLHAYMTSFTGYDFAEMPEGMDFDLAGMAHIPPEAMSAQQREMAASLMLRFGQPTFKKTYQYLRSFRLGDALANIRCPALALVGSGEGGEPMRQYNAFLQGVSGPAACSRSRKGPIPTAPWGTWASSPPSPTTGSTRRGGCKGKGTLGD